jgi:endo-1,4-beta-xylanase
MQLSYNYNKTLNKWYLNKGFKISYVKNYFLIIFLIGFLFPSQSYSQPLAYGKTKYVGNVIHSGTSLEPDFAKYWDEATLENDGKWGSVESSPGVYNFTALDNDYNYCLANGFPYKHHNLIWGSQQPAFMTNGSLDSAQMYQEIVNWIDTIAQRYSNASFVDVVNEPINTPLPYKNVLGGNGVTGWDWVINAFQLARNAFNKYAPNTKLLINEYSVINDGNANAVYLTIINLLKSRGLIDGIGDQGHYFEVDGGASITTLKTNLDNLTATGLPVYISEFDINQQNDSVQSARYQSIFPMLYNDPGVYGIELWGYTSGLTWKPYTYLVNSNGTERPALTWLRSFLSSGNFQSNQSGNWENVNTWESWNGTAWVAATHVPSLTDGSITIQNGHTINITASDTADKLTIASGGTLVVNSSANFAIQSFSSASLEVDGTLSNNGTITEISSPLILIQNGGKYSHGIDGGSVPIANWESGSTCEFDGIVSSIPSNVNQNFSNVIWNCPSQTSNLSFNWSRITISGNITVESTGSGILSICAPSASTSDTVNISGNIVQYGGQFTANSSSNAGSGVVINHGGNVIITGGDFSISRASQGGTGTTIWNLTNGIFSMSNASSQNLTTTPNGAKFVFSYPGLQTLTLGSGNTISSLPVEVKGGTTLATGTSVISGSGLFSLDPGATLECGNSGGLDSLLKTSGVVTLSNSANYIFNGTTAQITGAKLPASVSGLTINNTTGVTLSGSVLVNGTVNMQGGTLSLASDTLAYGNNGNLVYSGRTAQISTNTEFPSVNGPTNISLTNPHGVTLTVSRSITGSLNLNSNARFTLGNNNFAASSVLNTTSSYYVVTNGIGALTLPSGSSHVLYPVGTKTGYAPVTITNAGSPDTVGVSVMDDSAAAPYGGRVLAHWNLTSSTTGNVNNTIQFGWTFPLEDNIFQNAPQANAEIFLISGPDTTQAGSGAYTYQLTSQPYSVSRIGMANLGSYYVGSFGKPPVVLSLPTLVSPVGITNVSLIPKLIWHPSPSATSYRVQLATDSLFSSLVADSTLADTLLQLNSLAYKTKYFWHVRAIGAGDTTSFSVAASFTT